MANSEIITQGDEIDIVVTVDKSIESPSTLKFVVQAENSDVAAFEHSIAVGGLVATDATHFTVALSRADTLNLAPGNYTIQGEYQDAGSKFKSIIFNPNFIVIRKRLDFT